MGHGYDAELITLWIAVVGKHVGRHVDHDRTVFIYLERIVDGNWCLIDIGHVDLNVGYRRGTATVGYLYAEYVGGFGFKIEFSAGGQSNFARGGIDLEQPIGVAAGDLPTREDVIGVDVARTDGTQNGSRRHIFGNREHLTRQYFWQIVDILYRCGGQTGNGFCVTLIIGVARNHGDLRANVILGRGVGCTRRTANRHTVAQELIADRAAQTVGVSQRVRYRKQVALRRTEIINAHLSGGRIVDVRYGADPNASCQFRGAKTVGVAHNHGRGGSDIGITQGIGGTGCAADGHAIAEELVAEVAQTVGIADAGGVYG